MNRILLTIALSAFSVASFAQKGFWKTARKQNDQTVFENKISLANPRLFELNIDELKQAVMNAPDRFSGVKSTVIANFPNAEGKTERYSILLSSNMDPELAARYPEIKSYIGQGIDTPGAVIYFSISPLGLQTMAISPDRPAEFIEPYTTDLTTYSVFRRADRNDTNNRLECSLIDAALDNPENTTATDITARPNADDGKLRNYRLAISVNGEYTAFFGGTKALALAAINNTITRVNGVFERDFGVHLNLIANTDAVIYTSSTTDPYDNAFIGMTGSIWNNQLQTTLTNVIGNGNYDIGHLFGSYGGGGNAGCLGCVCRTPTTSLPLGKGSGYTSPANGIPQGDYFDIDYVAHEMGHQFGAAHSFTYQNEGTIAQVEPGSGSTIMSYAGIAGLMNVQTHSDPYFHAISIQQVTNFVKTTTCQTTTITGNAIPTADAGADYTIPKGTPFMLTGAATDGDGDALTYNWEQVNSGTAAVTLPLISSIFGPAFRSYIPSSSPTRYFPRLATVQAGLTFWQWEAVPNIARTMTFRLTVRDNQAGGPSNNSDDTTLTVNAVAGPFLVTSPNLPVSWTGGSTQTVTWNVAGTTENGVNAANVSILLSTDGGNTYPVTLIASTPNDGSQAITVPNTPGTQNRIMVKGASHVFFDISNTNFTITAGTGTDTTAPTAPTNLTASGTTQTTTILSWTAATDNVGVTSYSVYKNGDYLASVTSGTTYTATGLTASTAYAFTVKAKDAAGNISAVSNTVTITTLAVPDTTAPSAPIGLAASGTTQAETTLDWTASTDNIAVVGYNVYQNGTFKALVTTNTYDVTGLTAATIYSFTVKAKDAAGNLSSASNTATVTTLAVPDTIVPSTPLSLTASGTTQTATTLTWTASTDNVAVATYSIYQNGTYKGFATGTTYTATGLTAATTYAFTVKAKDTAGNLSAASNTATVTTLSIPDVTPPSAPISLAASGTTQTATTLDWTASTDNVAVAGYNVYQNGTFKASVTENTYDVAGLTAATTYAFSVKAKDTAGNISSVSNTATVTTLPVPDTTAPSAPLNLTASGTTQTATSLSWNASTDNVGVISYSIYKNGTYIAASATTDYDVTGLTAATTYAFTVKAKDAAGNISSVSNTATVTTLPVPDTTAPSAPINLAASGTTQTATTLSWDASTDNVAVATYSVYRNGSYIGATADTDYTVTGLVPATTYSFTVKAKDTSGNLSAASNTATVTTLAVPDTTAPSAPLALTASGTTQTGTILSWNAATDNVGVIGYNVYQNGVFKALVYDTDYSVSGLSPDTTYSFTVKAKDAAGNLSAASNTVTITTLEVPDTTAPSAPLSLSASGTTQTTTHLSWDASTDNVGVVSYSVYKNGSYVTGVLSGTACNVTGLTPATAYQFTVKAKDAAGNLSAASNTVTVTTLEIPDTNKPTAPTALTASGTTQTTTHLSWDASIDDVGVAYYNVYKDGQYLVSVSTGTSYNVANLTADTTYEFTVKARDIAGNLSDDSNIASVTTAILLAVGETVKPDFRIYPNPVTGEVLNISDVAADATYKIVNLLGQQITRGNVSNGTIPVADVATGVYLLEVTSEGNSIVKRFIRK